MTWDAYNRRKEALREVLATATRQRDLLSLTDLIDATPDARAAFPSDTDLLFELQMTWFQRLSGHMDRLALEGEEHPELIAVTAWVNTAADLPVVRELLDAHRDAPALRKAFAKELAYLAASAGVPGQKVQDSAREAWASAEPPAPAEITRPGLIARLRGAIAA